MSKDDDFFDFLMFNEIVNADSKDDCGGGGCGCLLAVALGFLALLFFIGLAG